ncbi:hypothetical protein SAMN04487897_109149 [Paenibacillus sp. yr247]|uniref:hypothetical protein n=1 Tax=Paenibacillus sp. yr247 TaxID=1761880 RepID=UPI00088A1676|nr:hypothetical protein [Paenibacillus sp. yr247]SDO18802.1 hypothetical protein SAMN04487897_109149 [Paenibacillus sp. yr247]
MRTAFLPSGKLVSADEYQESIHGFEILCMDKSCRAPLIFVPKSEKASSHFKTVGKTQDTKHSATCGFYSPLDIVEAIEKVTEYQVDVLESTVKKTLISLNMRGLDPDYEKKKTEREGQQEEQDPDKIKTKEKNENPSSISSLKSIVKLLVTYEPDQLSTIYFSIGNGRKMPISKMVLSQERAHFMLWNDQSIRDVGYFVYGRVQDFLRRDKVWFVRLEKVNDVPFTIVIFDKHFKHFTLSEEKLKGKDILIYGVLRKNEYQDRQTTEIIIKSDKYIEFLKRSKNE